MKKYTALLLLIGIAALITGCSGFTKRSPGTPATASDINRDLNIIFDLEALPEIEVSVTVTEWNRMLQNFDNNSKNEESVEADFKFVKNGVTETIPGIGLRIKGNTFSRKRPEGSYGEMHKSDDGSYHHVSFKLDFDEYDNDQRFLSLKSMALKWFNCDPAYVREIYCFDLFQRFGVTIAPRSSYCRLTIRFIDDNEAIYYGVYRMNEVMDSVFVKSRFTNNSTGFLWKCLWPSPLIDDGREYNVGVENIPLEGKGYEPAYDLKTRKKDLTNIAKPMFQKFVRDLSTLQGEAFKNWIAKNFDVPLLLRAMAVNVAVGMWDDYWANQNNFYLYFDETGKGWFIPYDYDNTLGTAGRRDPGFQSAIDWGGNSNDIYTIGEMRYYPRPLIQKVLEIPEYLELYKKYLAELTDPKADYFAFEPSAKRIEKWQKMIADYVENDTYEDNSIFDAPAPWGGCRFYRLLTGDINDGSGEPANYFKTRCDSIRKEIGVK